MKLLLIGTSLAFLTLVLFVPLAAIFAEALRKGFGVYFASFTDPHALSAIRLTLLVVGDLRAAEPGVWPGGRVGDRQVSISAARAC